ncbi:MAG: hypothetical protein AABX05_01965, partial [Nanoarchaeota archaeon]
GSKEIWIRWRLFKPAENTPYLNYFLDVDFHVIGLGPGEAIKDGKKIKADKGELEVTIRAFIEKNYEEEFAKHGLLKNVLNIFSQRIYRKALEQRRLDLYREAYVLQTYIKQWFRLKTYHPYEETENFFPSKAWPSHQ